MLWGQRDRRSTAIIKGFSFDSTSLASLTTELLREKSLLSTQPSQQPFPCGCRLAWLEQSCAEAATALLASS